MARKIDKNHVRALALAILDREIASTQKTIQIEGSALQKAVGDKAS